MTPEPRSGAPGPSAAGRVVAATALAVGLGSTALAPAPLAAAALVAAVSLIAGSRRLLREAGAPALLVVGVSVVPVAFAGAPDRAGLLFLRAGTVLGATLPVLGGMADGALAPGLAALGVPEPLAAIVGGAVRSARLLGDEGRRLRLARQLRGPRGLLDGATLASALLGRAAARAERVELALALRGPGPAFRVEREALRPADARLVALSLLGVGLTLAAGVLGG